MRLYLSSYKMGNQPQQMLPLIGDNKRTAIIMNAQDARAPESRRERLEQEIESLEGLGLKAEELDLRHYFDNPAELEEAVKGFGYIWVRGGNVFLLRRAFKQSGFDKILTRLLKEDTVAYGGFSAGVCILAPSLHGIELVDPTDELAEGYDMDIVWDGLGILEYAVAPHYKSDHPESADIDKCVDYFKEKQISYKTLRDGEAIVINDSTEKLVS